MSPRSYDGHRGTIQALCVSTQRGTQKKPVASVTCKAGSGIEGDAHAGPGPRQVSLLATRDIARMEEYGVFPRPGEFAENIVVDGTVLTDVQVGDIIAAEKGPVFRVTMIGKECHDAACPIRRRAGTCIMPTHGVFTEVLESGKLTPGTVLYRKEKESVARR